MVPAGVQTLVDQGHDVMIETKAGLGAGIPDEAYEAVGARIVSDAETAWDAELVIKVKEPIQPEWHRMKSGQTLYTYLHLAADAPLTEELMKKGVQSVAYETVQLNDSSLPLLRPMSEVAGRLCSRGCDQPRKSPGRQRPLDGWRARNAPGGGHGARRWNRRIGWSSNRNGPRSEGHDPRYRSGSDELHR